MRVPRKVAKGEFLTGSKDKWYSKISFDTDSIIHICSDGVVSTYFKSGGRSQIYDGMELRDQIVKNANAAGAGLEFNGMTVSDFTNLWDRVTTIAKFKDTLLRVNEKTQVLFADRGAILVIMSDKDVKEFAQDADKTLPYLDALMTVVPANNFKLVSWADWIARRKFDQQGR